VPSLWYEVFGLVIIEAFAQGTPAIVRNIGGMPQIIEESGGGLVYETETELVAAIDRLLTESALRTALGVRGYQAFRQRWSAEAHIERYLALIAVADVDRTRCTTLVPDVRLYNSARALVTAGNVDGVVIATPTRAHVSDARAIAEAGLPALVEKPRASTLARRRDSRASVRHSESDSTAASSRAWPVSARISSPGLVRGNPLLTVRCAGTMSPALVASRDVRPKGEP